MQREGTNRDGQIGQTRGSEQIDRTRLASDLQGGDMHRLGSCYSLPASSRWETEYSETVLTNKFTRLIKLVTFLRALPEDKQINLLSLPQFLLILHLCVHNKETKKGEDTRGSRYCPGKLRVSYLWKCKQSRRVVSTNAISLAGQTSRANAITAIINSQATQIIILNYKFFARYFDRIVETRERMK